MSKEFARGKVQIQLNEVADEILQNRSEDEL